MGEGYVLKRRTIVSTGVALAATALLSTAAPAGATPIAGVNGRIVLMSEQNTGFQKGELFLKPVPFLGGGTLSPPITNSPTLRHRHPTWSPDRTKIAFARGPAGAGGPYDIFVQDLTTPLSATNPLNLTQSVATEDRPAWSPDGTHIAFEKGDNGMPPANRDIFIASAANGSGQTPVTDTAAGTIEGKPAWAPGGFTLYYEKGNAQDFTINTNIVRRSISYPGGVPTAGAEGPAVTDSGGPEIQPSISPDGQKICYGTGYPGATTPDVRVALITAGATTGTEVSTSVPSYYCTWSPDSGVVAYTAGGGSAGELVAVELDGSTPGEIPLVTGADIQTNPDWAPDGRPDCPNSTATAISGQPTTIPVQCNDTGPQYERSEVRESINDDPQNGTADQDLAGDPITYTSNPGFVGTDFIGIRSFDEFGFGADTGVIAVTVSAPQANPPANNPAANPAKKCKKKKKKGSKKKKCKKKKKK